jgi:hypothetical protein
VTSSPIFICVVTLFCHEESVVTLFCHEESVVTLFCHEESVVTLKGKKSYLQIGPPRRETFVLQEFSLLRHFTHSSVGRDKINACLHFLQTFVHFLKTCLHFFHKMEKFYYFQWACTQQCHRLVNLNAYSSGLGSVFGLTPGQHRRKRETETKG